MGCGSSSTKTVDQQDSGDDNTARDTHNGSHAEPARAAPGDDLATKKKRRATLSTSMMTDHVYDFAPFCVQSFVAENGLPSADKPLLRKYETAVVAIVDISGFSNLTRVLTEKRGGVRGAEELSRALNSVFTQMVEILSLHGGQVLKYAGDALIVLWTLPDLGTGVADGLWLVMEDVVRTTHAVKAMPMNLSMHSAIAVGEVTMMICGGYGDRYEYLVYGSPLNELGDALDKSVAGEAVFTASALKVATPRDIGRKVDTYCVISLNDFDVDTSAVEGNLSVQRQQLLAQGTPASPAIVRAFVPAGIDAQLEAGLLEWLAELRDIAVLFVNLPDLRSDEQTTKFHHDLQIMQREIRERDGVVRQILVDDKGCVLIAIFGLGGGDSSTHRDLNAVECALAISEHKIPRAIGITTGRAFVGLIGHELRREYAAVGHLVNMSARLMGKAGKTETKVVCSALVQTTVKRDQKRPPCLSFLPLDPVTVKGSDVALEIFQPYMSDTPDSNAATGQFIGRRKELSSVLSHTDALVKDQKSSWMVIEAPAGMGKTTLINEIESSADQTDGVAVMRIAATPQSSTRPYSVFPALLKQLLYDGEEGESIPMPDRILTLVSDTLGEAAFAPILNIVLGTSLDETDATRNLAGKSRQAETARLLARIIATLVKQRSDASTLIILDDVHWLDEPSWFSISKTLDVGEAEAGLALQVIIGSRPEDEFKVDASMYKSLVSSAKDGHVIRLEGFGLDEISAQLVSVYRIDAKKARDVPANLLEFIHTQTQGVPYYSHELGLSLLETGAVIVSTDGTIAVDHDKMTKVAKTSLQDVVSGRIHSLSIGAQMFVKCASVVGADFDYNLLLTCLPGDLGDDLSACEQYLQEATRKSLFAYSGSKFHFVHAITAETAYSLLTYQQRCALHTAVADALLDLYGSEASDDLLAHHFKNAEKYVESQRYLIRAAKNLFDANAHQQAEQLIAEAIELHDAHEECRDAVAGVRNQLAYMHWMKGESIMSQGASNTGIDQLKTFLDTCGHVFPREEAAIQADLQAAVDRVQGGKLGLPSVNDSTHKIKSAPSVVEILPIVLPDQPIPDDEVRKARCLAYFRIMAYCLFRSRRSESYLAQLSMIEAATDLGVFGYHLARAWTNAQNFALYFDNCDRSFYLQRAEEVLEQVDDVTAARNVGYLAYYDNLRGLFGDSARRMTKAVDMLFAQNLKEDAENSNIFLLTALTHLGALSAVKAYSQRMLESALSRGYTAHVEPALRFLASAALFQEAPVQALELNARIRAEQCVMGKWYQCHFDVREAVAHVQLAQAATDDHARQDHITKAMDALTAAHKCISDPQMPPFMATGALFAFDSSTQLLKLVEGSDKSTADVDQLKAWSRVAIEILERAKDMGAASSAPASLCKLEYEGSTEPSAWVKVAEECLGPAVQAETGIQYPHAQRVLLHRIQKECERLKLDCPPSVAATLAKGSE